MAALNKFQSFVEALGRKVHNLHADTLKVMLSNVAPVATNSLKAHITEIAAGNGYVAGGSQIGGNQYVQAAGVAKLTGNNVIISASGGPIGPFRYAVVYNDTALNDELIGWYDYGAAATLQAGESVNVKFDAVNGILTNT